MPSVPCRALEARFEQVAGVGGGCVTRDTHYMCMISRSCFLLEHILKSSIILYVKALQATPQCLSG